MRVARMKAPREIELGDAPIPTPGSGEVLVRIRAVGLCGSDLQYYSQGRIGDVRFTAGHILGHEVAGVVEVLGPDTEGPPPGTPVAVDPAISCGRCRFCLMGDPNFCSALQFFGSPPKPGALSEFVSHPGHLLYPLPEGMPSAVGAIIEPLGVAIHAVDLSHLALGDRIAVFGCGPIGLLIVRVARLAGAVTILASEPLAHRREAAARFGATAALDPSAEDIVNAIADRTDGEGVDVAFEAAGNQEATQQAIRAVRPGGTVVLLGYWKCDEVMLPGITAMRKGLTIRFIRRMKNTFGRAIELARQGAVDLPALISHTFALASVAEGFARAERRAPDVIKAVIAIGV